MAQASGYTYEGYGVFHMTVQRRFRITSEVELSPEELAATINDNEDCLVKDASLSNSRLITSINQIDDDTLRILSLYQTDEERGRHLQIVWEVA